MRENMYLYETHLHSSECSACASSTAREMVRRYKEAGYAGFVLTNHFITGCTCVPKELNWDEKMKIYYDAHLEAKDEADQLDFDVFFGIEHHYGKGKEVLAYGIDLDFLKSHPEIETSDIDTFARMYSSIITVESLGTSELGRDIPVFRIGREDAEYHVLFHASIHGREHMTTWLLMAMVEYQLAHGIQDLDDVCFHIIPMVNPDGVILSQTASFTEEQLKIYNMDKMYGNTYYGKTWYASQWKANALGVDLNRNFPSGWEDIATRLEPSSEKYNGTEPLCAAESKALSEYTLRYEFDATISYHSSGCVIYYKYGDDEEMIDQCESLANAVYKVTGYVVQDGDEIDGGGYRDWAIAELGIPSITVEIGCDPAPLEYREIYSAFARNYDVLRAVAQWVKESK